MKHLFFLVTVFTISMQTIAQEQKPMVSVTGEGIVKIVPDQVSIRMSMEHTGKNLKEVKADNDQATDAVLAFLKKNKIADKDIQTQHVRLNKSYDYNTKTYKYSANQTLTVLLRDLKSYDQLMHGLLESGANRIDGITFGSSKIEDLQTEARDKAIDDAKRKAIGYATRLGQKIGKAVSISESLSQAPPVPMYRQAMALDSALGEVETLAVGEMTVSARIHVGFELL